MSDSLPPVDTGSQEVQQSAAACESHKASKGLGLRWAEDSEGFLFEEDFQDPSSIDVRGRSLCPAQFLDVDVVIRFSSCSGAEPW